jgi:uncharacterized protein (DUF2336 family)
MQANETVHQPEHSIIAELEEAVRSGSSQKRVSTLREITNLFLHGGERLNEEQIKIFDNVLCMLVARVETRARAELSKCLSTLDYAPVDIIQRLARDDEIAVAGSVLTHSSRLAESTLVEVASTKGQEHLMAISGRANLTEAVTDIIVDRGENRVIHKLAGNATARFSEAGYSELVVRAETDDELTAIIGMRVDLPAKDLRELLRRATDAVRTQLLAIAPPDLQEEIKRVLKTFTDVARGDGLAGRDFSMAEEAVKRMKGLNELNDSSLLWFAEAKRFSEIAAGLALLNNVPTEMIARVLEGLRADLVLIPCRSAGLKWPTVEKILMFRPVKHRIDAETLKLAERDYGRLSLDTAQRTLRFWMVHNKIGK